MSNGIRVATAVGAGYLLGRTRKMRLAFMLAAAGLTGKFPARPSDLMIQGLQSLSASEQFNQLSDQLRGELLGAARVAAVTAATSQVDALNNRLQGVTTDLGLEETLGEAGAGRDAGKDKDYEDDDVDTFEDLDEDELDKRGVDEDYTGQIPDEEPGPSARRRTMRQAAPAKSAARRSARAEAHDEPRARAARRRPAAVAPVRRGR